MVLELPHRYRGARKVHCSGAHLCSSMIERALPGYGELSHKEHVAQMDERRDRVRRGLDRMAAGETAEDVGGRKLVDMEVMPTIEFEPSSLSASHPTPCTSAAAARAGALCR